MCKSRNGDGNVRHDDGVVEMSTIFNGTVCQEERTGHLVWTDICVGEKAVEECGNGGTGNIVDNVGDDDAPIMYGDAFRLVEPVPDVPIDKEADGDNSMHEISTGTVDEDGNLQGVDDGALSMSDTAQVSDVDDNSAFVSDLASFVGHALPTTEAKNEREDTERGSDGGNSGNYGESRGASSDGGGQLRNSDGDDDGDEDVSDEGDEGDD